MRTKLAMLMIMALSAIIISGCEPDEPVNPVNPTPVVPKISTIEVTKLAAAKVLVSSLILDNGGAEITEAGICWRNDTIAPTIQGLTLRAYVKEGAFSLELTLQPSHTYTVRAYAKNSVGLAYGECITFSTDALPPPEPELPEINRGTLVSRTSNSAIFTGTVIDSGYCHISEVGICWSKTGTPTINDNRQAISNPSVGEFTVRAPGLEKLSDYIARIYVTNVVGTNYGDPISFYTYDSVVDADGNYYLGVRIGSQVWLTANLKTTHFNNGDPIPYLESDNSWASAEGPGYCWYDNDLTRANTAFGALYNWWVGSDPRGVAPEGYHVPTVEDIHEFGEYFGLDKIRYLDNSTEIHYYMYKGGRSIRTNYAWIPVLYGNNASGFTCLPTGSRFSDGDFISKNYRAAFWSSSSFDNASAWQFETGGDNDNDYIFVQGRWEYKVYGRAIRCVKD